MLRMETKCMTHARRGLDQAHGCLPSSWIKADVEPSDDTRVDARRDNVVPVGVKRGVVEVTVGVDELGAQISRAPTRVVHHADYFTVTLLAKLRGWSGSVPRFIATSCANRCATAT